MPAEVLAGVGSREARPDARRPRDAAWTALAGLAALALYAATLCPGVYWGDSAELTAAAVHLGVAHPPGYPLYVTLAHVFTWLPLEPAVAVNLFSVAATALAVALCFRLGRELGARPLAALAGAGLYATGPVVWSNAVVAEVYGPGAAFVAATWLLVLRGARCGDRRLLWAGALTAGLGLGVHLFVATTGLGLVVAVASARPADPAGARVRTLLGCAACAALGACCFLLLATRGSSPIPLTWGDPSQAGGLWYIVRGGEFRHWRLPDGASVDQWREIGLSLLRGAAGIGLPLAAVGLARLARRERATPLALALGMAGNLWFFHDFAVPDIEVFLLPTQLLACAASAPGWEGLLRAAEMRGARSARAALLAAALATPLVSGAAAWRVADRSGDRAAEAWAARLCERLPPEARFAYFTSRAEWHYYTVFHLHHQLVRGCRPDVEVWTAPPPRRIERALAEGRPVFLFASVPVVARRFSVSAVAGADGWLRVERAGAGS